MSTLIKLKMENLSTRSANENRTLNAQIKQLYDTMSANPAINAFIESQDGHEHWIRFASLIEGWLGCESNVAQQSIEMAELFKEVMASKGIDMGVKDGQLKVQGKTEVARGMAEWMGFDAEGRCNRRVLPHCIYLFWSDG